MHSHSNVDEPKTGWRNNWFVKNVLAEIPIIGGFFESNDIKQCLYQAGKSTAMLAGGTTGMIVDMLIQKGKIEDMTLSMTVTTANMAVGMAAGSIAYNILTGLSQASYKQYALWRNASSPDETTHLIVADDRLALNHTGP